jgi:hypothetical protein
MKETDDKIVVFGGHDYRYEIPKSKIFAVGMNVILDMDYLGEPIEKLAEEE